MEHNYIGESLTLAEKAKEYIKNKGKTIQALADEIGYARPTLSRYLSGKYDSGVDELENALKGYLASAACDNDAHQAEPRAVWRKTFFQSADAKSILGVCSSCQEYKALGVIVGKSGYGKTYTLKQFAKLSRVAYVECDDAMGSRDLIEAIERSLGLPAGYGTASKRINSIREFCNVNRGYLIIIDEADKLISKYTQKKMELLRSIFDQASVGMIIAGEPKLESMIRSYLERFRNRVDFCVRMGGLSAGEVDRYLDGLRLDGDALSELKTRACNNQTGCFRLLDRTLNNVLRVLYTNSVEVATLKTISEASNMMML